MDDKNRMVTKQEDRKLRRLEGEKILIDREIDGLTIDG
jgi:hypothetical protein